MFSRTAVRVSILPLSIVAIAMLGGCTSEAADESVDTESALVAAKSIVVDATLSPVKGPNGKESCVLYTKTTSGRKIAFIEEKASAKSKCVETEKFARLDEVSPLSEQEVGLPKNYTSLKYQLGISVAEASVTRLSTFAEIAFWKKTRPEYFFVKLKPTTKLTALDSPSCFLTDLLGYEEEASEKAEKEFSPSTRKALTPTARLTTVERAQLTEFLRQEGISNGRPLTLAEIIDHSEGGEAYVRTRTHLKSGRTFRTFEYYPGGNAYGMIFEGEKLEVVGRLNDGDLFACSTF
ncbi:MAG: hypothetical protein KBF88_13000 [Polyangiaceae bacterium]|nr:hypothetical protein [Polyangiaceae bacterium]